MNNRSKNVELVELQDSEILLVEPVSEARVAIAGTLRGCGAKLVELSSGPLATCYLGDGREPPEVIIIGPAIEFAESDELLIAVRQTYGMSPTLVPMVLVTPATYRGERRATIEQLFQARVAEDADERQLISTIRRVVRKRRETLREYGER